MRDVHTTVQRTRHTSRQTGRQTSGQTGSQGGARALASVPPDLSRRSTRVVVVDDHLMLAESLEMAIGMLGFDVRMRTPEADTTPKSLLAWVLRQRPSVVVLDLNLGAVGDSTRLIGPLARAGVSVVVLTASTDQVGWGGCLAAGASTVMSKTGPLHELMAVVRRLAEGRDVLDAADRYRLVELWQRGRSERRDALERLRTLTRREEVVLGHLTRGRAVRQIADRLVVSEATVRTQVKAVLAKLEVSSQLAAVGLAHSVGWQPPFDARPPAVDARQLAAAL